MRRGLILCVCAFAALSLGVASCSSTATQSVTTSGSKLTVYASVPTDTPQGPDILAAEQLAFKQFEQSTGGRVDKLPVKLAIVRSTNVSADARTAIEDLSSAAYIGDLAPGASADSMGITNAVDLLQVSPTDTALELTQSSAAVPGAPGNYYEAEKTYGRTFARVVPNTAQEAKAQVQEMAALGVKKLYVTDDGSAYGAAIALAVKDDAGSTLAAQEGPPRTPSFQASGADALFFGAGPASASAAARLFASVGQASPKVKLFGSSSLDDSAFTSSLGAAKLNLYVSAPGFLPKDLPPAGKTFVADFKSAYGHVPATGAIFAYEAMSAVLAVLREAGSSATDRSTVVKDFFGIRNRSSALGTYSIDSFGDTSIAPYVFSRLHDGALVPFRQVQG